MVRLRSYFANHPVVLAAILYIGAICIIFAPVVFLGRTLQAPAYAPHGVTDNGTFGYAGRVPINVFNIDLATPAYYEWPINVLVGQTYKNGEIPLWNPYQGAGAPLAAQYSSRAFFPYQIIEDISPNWTWDFFMLGRLWVAGIFTFLFLRRAKLSWVSSFTGGILYMFSGTFIWFINLEQFVNVAMVTPFLMWAIEGSLQWEWKWGTMATAVAVAMVLLAGQPETALYVLLLAATYVTFLVMALPVKARIRQSLILSFAGILGLMLAAPLILLFLEFIPNSYTFHPPGGNLGVLSPTPISNAPLIGLPTFYNAPTWFRFLPDNGYWDYLGGYTGIILPFLVAVGLVLGFIQNKSRWLRLLLFFAIFGTFILLKNFGFPLVSWIGYLPLFDQAWTPRWAGPAWTFPLAVAAALGLEILRDQVKEPTIRDTLLMWWQKFKQRGPIVNHLFTGFNLVVIAITFTLGISIVYYLRTYRNTIDPTQIYSPGVSSSLSTFVAAAIVAIAIFAIWHCLRRKSSVGVFAILAMTELWFAIPSGYPQRFVVLQIIPLALGFSVAISFLLSKRVLTIIGSTLCIIIIVLLDTVSPNGYPDRYDPITVPPYIQFLKNQDGHYRTTGGNGVLFPNFASAVGIQDIRYINALTPKSYNDFRSQNLHGTPLYPDSSFILWFTGMPQTDVNINGNAERIQREFKYDINSKLPFYSLLGVKYILAPASYNLGLPKVSNLLVNGNLDAWARGKGPFSYDGETWADGWLIDLKGNSSINISQDSREVDKGSTYFAKVAYVNDENSYLNQLIPDFNNLLGKTISASIRIKTSQSRAIRIAISEGDKATTWSEYHPGDGTWQTLSVSHPVDKSGGKVLLVTIELSGTGEFYLGNSTLHDNPIPPTHEDILGQNITFPLVYDQEVRIYQNPQVLPRTWIASQVEYASTLDEAQNIIKKPDFDFEHKVVLERPLTPGFSPSQDNSSTSNITQYQSNRVVISTQSEKPGILVLSDIYYPGWQAYIDGQPTDIYRVDSLLRGVELREGSHIVEFTYSPKTFKIGLIIAIIASLFLGVLCFMPRHRLSRKPFERKN